jgi:hypothetical protein
MATGQTREGPKKEEVVGGWTTRLTKEEHHEIA